MYVSTSLTWLYDPANYFTDIEYRKKYLDCKLINVQGLVEKPKLYIIGQSGSSDLEQSSYTAVKNEDLQILSEPITSEYCKIHIFDVMRVFSGDGPARQFKIGQQRGGNYPCVCGVHANDHGVWWHMEDGNMIFHDEPGDEPSCNDGLEMHHFRSSSYKEEHQIIKDIWKTVPENFRQKDFLTITTN
ncbi:unnamed protein product [Mytilus coruscus]|uniref:Uncharacterized protein n=1 Tax=Mytilus coruscus TaxID=42192 RepID=A0A6J8BWC1_MYTCO|nr:unnamed protein product [Mytilus coruscus]